MTTAQTMNASLTEMRSRMEKTATLWQDTLEQSMTRYQEQWRQAGAIGTSFWSQMLPADSPHRLVSERLCALGRASGEFASALSLAPVPGSNPEKLAERFLAVMDANRALMLAYVELLKSWQQSQVAITGELITATRQAVALQRSAIDAMDETVTEIAEAATDAADTAVTRAEEAAITTAEVAEAAVAEAAETVTEAIAESGQLIKGNVSRAGEKIYHLPGQANYDRILAEAFFATEADAEAAGYRASRR